MTPTKGGVHALNPIPATFLRGGTSKGIFLQEKHLPADRSLWNTIFLRIMGSPDSEYGRQLNGMGGGVSSLSKICVISPPSAEQKIDGIDVQYTFVQVGIRDSIVDYSGNCGNLSSVIGVYAIDEGLCHPNAKDGRVRVRSLNKNTNKIIDTTFPVTEGGLPSLDLPEVTIAGVPGSASQIILDFVDPGGARTGKLLPTGNAIDTLRVQTYNEEHTKEFTASLIDATNPTVFLSYDELEKGHGLPMEGYINGLESSTSAVGDLLEHIRKAGAERMGLDPCAPGQPKIAFLHAPRFSSDLLNNVHIVTHALSMGVLHKAVPMTVGLCLGVASKIEGTIPWRIVSEVVGGSRPDFIRLRHPGGTVDVGAKFDENCVHVKSANVIRSGRRLMKGSVWW